MFDEMNPPGMTNWQSSQQLVRKTISSSEKELTTADFLAGKEKLNLNVLNNYRSYTYNFTLFCPKKIDLEDTENISGEIPVNAIIARSGGKGNKNKFEADTVQDLSAFTTDDTNFNKVGDLIDRELKDFNENSSGRFDLFIDNVRIAVLPQGLPTTNNTAVQKIEFEVLEPYSAVGFMEALRNAAIISGYRGINGTTYCLKMEFFGYPDDEDASSPQPIPKTLRYFLFKFININNKIGPEGTMYSCEAMSADAEAASLVAQSRSPIQAKGNTVYEVLKSAAEQFTNNSKNELKRRFGEQSNNARKSDEWEVIWLDDKGNEIENPQVNSKIAKSKIGDKTTINSLYAFERPESTNVNNAYQPDSQLAQTRAELGTPTLIFRKNTNFHDIINAVIRDSDYLPGIFQTTTESDITIPFWFIWLKTETLSFGSENNGYFKKFTYIIRERPILKTSLPGYESAIVSSDQIDYLISRDYEYIYTGKNIDIIDFNIEFDAMFYSYGSAGDGNSDVPQQRNVQANSNASKPLEELAEVEITSTKRQQADDVPIPKMPISQSRRLSVNAGPPKDDPWYILARNAYEFMLQTYPGQKLTNLSITIVGDPFYLVTENFSGVISTTSDTETSSGQANIATGVYVTLRFRNPTDYDPETGFMSFDDNGRTNSFTGVYKVTNIENTFDQGVFQTRLDLFKEPGIILEELNEVKIKSAYKSVPNPEAQRVENIGEEKAADTCRSGVLKELVSGISKIADTVQQAEARIVGAIEGAATGLSSAVSDAIQVPASKISEVTNKINGVVQGINSTVVDAGNKLGISPSQLTSLSPRELVTMVAISKILPNKFDLKNAEDKGICLVNSDDVNNLPPSQSSSS